MRDIAYEMGLLGKRCSECVVEFGVSAWPLEYFDYRPNGICRNSNDPYCEHAGCYTTRCVYHSLTQRTERDIFEKKVEGSFRRHAKQDGITLKQLLTRWGTTVKRQAAKYRTEYGDGVCPKDQFGCGRAWTSMPHGPNDMTFDRIDPHGPFLPHNVGLLCITCNIAKRKMPPERFAIRHRCWQIVDELPRVPKPVQDALFAESECL